ncbi:UNVERIFIED_CONTAM: hypothetical protein FKN15_008156 [Acipenser sinensis]
MQSPKSYSVGGQRSSGAAYRQGCGGTWDNLTCWKPAEIGDTVTLSCPKVFSHFFSKTGNISKNCTANGWSEIFPDIYSACGFNDNVMQDEKVGHSASLIALTTGSAVLCVFRRLAKSTLLLIPLFGIHYIVFISERSPSEYKIVFELAIGSFQLMVREPSRYAPSLQLQQGSGMPAPQQQQEEVIYGSLLGTGRLESAVIKQLRLHIRFISEESDTTDRSPYRITDVSASCFMTGDDSGLKGFDPNDSFPSNECKNKNKAASNYH